MPKGSPELTAARKEEIINACEQLYQTMSFKEITLKEIGNVTSFTRTSIYNYFQTKVNENEQLTKKELAELISHSLAGRQQLLKLLSMNNFDMEANSRQELLTAFKHSYGRSMQLISMVVQKFCPEMTVSDIQNFIYIFFPFMFGIYPYTEVTEKQRAAMKEAGINYVYQSAYELIYSGLTRLLGA